MAVFLLFAALLGVSRAEASLPKAADVAGVTGLSRPALQLPAVASIEPSRFGFAEDLTLLNVEEPPRFSLIESVETRRFERTYARNNPLKYVDPDGREVVYADRYARKAAAAARKVSPGTDRVLKAFEADRTRTLTFATGDAPDPPGVTRLAQTGTKPPSDPKEKPSEFLVTIDKKDIKATGSDVTAVAIHEVVGHVEPNSERPFEETRKLTPEQREADAQDRTVDELKNIPKDQRPTLPGGHKKVDDDVERP